MSRVLALATVATLLVGCGLTRVTEPDPAQIPDGPLVALPGNPQATGPITEVGRGRTLGFGWRYLVYPSADGLCTQLEMAMVSSSSCGAGAPTADEEFSGIGVGESSGGPATVEGVAGDGVAEVWLQLAGGERIAAALMSLEPANLPGQAFVGLAPEGSELESVVALDAAGDEVGTFVLGP